MDSYKEKIAAYRLAMNMAYAMQKKGIISEEDFEKVRRAMAEKYGISSSSIFYL